MSNGGGWVRSGRSSGRQSSWVRSGVPTASVHAPGALAQSVFAFDVEMKRRTVNVVVNEPSSLAVTVPSGLKSQPDVDDTRFTHGDVSKPANGA